MVEILSGLTVPIGCVPGVGVAPDNRESAESEPSATEPVAIRDDKGRFGPGNCANPGGRPKAWKNYQIWLKSKALGKAKQALLDCLEHPDGKVQMMAVREVNDRLFGKPKQIVTGEDGGPIPIADIGLLALLQKLGGDGK